MSLNCPKCGFYQPEDQYCASCGVDMKKYQPKEQPLWRKILGNWIFQLALLIVVVVVVILFDSLSSKSPDIAQRPLPKATGQPRPSSKISSQGKVLPPPAEKGKAMVLPPSMDGSAPVAVTANTETLATPVSRAQEELNTLKKVRASEKVAQTAKPLAKKIASFFYLVPRATLDNLMSKGSSTEDGITLLRSGDFGRELKTNRADWKKLGSQRQSFEFNKSKLIFVGGPAGETSDKVGFYIRTTVTQPEDASGRLNVELRTWSELKPGGDSVEGPSTSLEFSRREIVFVSNFVPRDLAFSETERTYFEGHPALRALNDPQFIEENLELVLVLQYK